MSADTAQPPRFIFRRNTGAKAAAAASVPSSRAKIWPTTPQNARLLTGTAFASVPLDHHDKVTTAYLRGNQSVALNRRGFMPCQNCS
jgi:hypothetical protein